MNASNLVQKIKQNFTPDEVQFIFSAIHALAVSNESDIAVKSAGLINHEVAKTIKSM